MMFSTSLFYVFICLWLCGSDGVVSGFKIYRSKRDIFTNLKCTDDACTESQCSMYDAECVSEDNCKYCRCLEGTNTFIISGIDQGKCKSDEDIEPKSVPNAAFWLKNQDYKCLQLQNISNIYIIGKDCIVSPTPDMLWIRTTRNEQIMNVKTLKCMRVARHDGNKITLNSCKSEWRQRIHCNQNEQGMLQFRWYISFRDSRSLYLPKPEEYGSPYAIFYSDGDQLWNSRQTSCPTKTTYEGCYRFSDGSFMKYLNQRELGTSLKILAPIFQENNHKNCQVSMYMEFSQDGQDWETTTRVFSTTVHDKSDGRGLLKEIEISFHRISSMNVNSADGGLVCSAAHFEGKKEWGVTRAPRLYAHALNQRELFKVFNGTLLKLSVKCRREKHCVLFKLESKPNYNEETGNPLEGPSEEVSESAGTNTAAIASGVTVTLLMVALALALGFLVYYRRRKRAQVQQNSNNAVVNDSMSVYENPDRTYETLKDNGAEVSPNKPGGTSSGAYSYPNDNIVANPPSNEQEYTYAKETDFPRSSVGSKPEAQGQIQNGVVYETLYQPGQPDDDGFYNYPENTTIPKPPASELEYTYAKDTDFPRNTGEDRKIKGDGVPATATSDDGFYHTLESEEPVPNPEQEYNYAENTDIPSHRLGAQQNNDHSSPPESTGLYHTLEEPVPPPQLPVYSTLEESADGQK